MPTSVNCYRTWPWTVLPQVKGPKKANKRYVYPEHFLLDFAHERKECSVTNASVRRNTPHASWWHMWGNHKTPKARQLFWFGNRVPCDDSNQHHRGVYSQGEGFLATPHQFLWVLRKEHDSAGGRAQDAATDQWRSRAGRSLELRTHHQPWLRWVESATISTNFSLEIEGLSKKRGLFSWCLLL